MNHKFKYIHYVVLIVVSVLAISCEEEIPIELKNDILPKVVVEGRIVNQEKNQLIRFSYSDDYFVNKPAKGTEVSNLIVTEAGTGNVFSFSMKDTNGYYLSDTPFKGITGETYELTFTVKGEDYVSNAYLDIVPIIDSINYFYEYFDFFGGAGFYQIKMTALEPQPAGDYYIFNLFINDSLYNDELRLTATTDDELINGKNLIDIDIFFLPQEEISLDTNLIRLEMLSISKEEYDFIQAFITETQANGNMFAGPPADIPTNIKNLTSDNDGLGFFAASSIASMEIPLYKEHADSTNNPDYEK